MYLYYFHVSPLSVRVNSDRGNSEDLHFLFCRANLLYSGVKCVAVLGISTTNPLCPYHTVISISLTSQIQCEMRVFVWMICMYCSVCQCLWLRSVFAMLSLLFPPSAQLNREKWNQAMFNIQVPCRSLAKCAEIRCNCSNNIPKYLFVSITLNIKTEFVNWEIILK